MNINEYGESGTIQRVVYLAARARTDIQWDRVYSHAVEAMQTLIHTQGETSETLLLNALLAALEARQ